MTNADMVILAFGLWGFLHFLKNKKAFNDGDPTNYIVFQFALIGTFTLIIGASFEFLNIMKGQLAYAK